MVFSMNHPGEDRPDEPLVGVDMRDIDLDLALLAAKALQTLDSTLFLTR